MKHPGRSLLLGLATSSIVAAFASVSRADIAPPPGWKESCTEDQQKKPGEECLSCSAFYGNAQHCSKLLTTYAFESRCKTRGASVWTELWCRGASPSAKKVPANIMSALGNPNDNGDKDKDAGPVAPTPEPDAATSAVPSTTSTASAEPTTTSTSTSSAPPATKLPTEDTPKKGACGACAIGASSSSAPTGLLALAMAIAWLRRARRR
jgi:hypothetical protein